MILSQTIQIFLLLLCLHNNGNNAQTEGDLGDDLDINGFDEESILGYDPLIDKLSETIIVMKNQTAVLPCSIEYLGIYKVLWLDVHNLPISFEEKRVIDDSRFSVIRASDSDWNLQIRDVKTEDEGVYRCSVNTNPPISKTVQLHVKFPPSIIHNNDSDITVYEGDTIKLLCHATGQPKPNVTWRKSTNQSNSCKFKSSAINEVDSTYVMYNVTRDCDGVYLCEATNHVPPPASRSFNVIVESSMLEKSYLNYSVAPKVFLRNDQIFQGVGKETILICLIIAFPHAVNHWEKNGKRITSSEQYYIETYSEPENKLILSLKIKIKSEMDFGEYKCVAANKHGRQEKYMLLKEIKYDYHTTDSFERKRKPTALPTFYSEPSYAPMSSEFLYSKSEYDRHTLGKLSFLISLLRFWLT
ncbi:hypothetical protein HELRODRAFT_193056 [Helobdella robusta]|uniref:Ig-like domain-containing protein n=1 Tax=Helobdella robusta TaxID=6412 RepID=T1FUK9_HELRO|nr:hypothetical protein HELRODRAFT_193056 [Helobdella robusta]ESN98356.1 hypothetical protein HELRODRAFT_193056 [Helobdella robusta]